MTMPARHETSESANKPRRDKTLIVLDVALAIIVTGTLFAVVERNLNPIATQAAPMGQETPERAKPDADIKRITTYPAPRDTWYTPAQYPNKATEVEVLPAQF
jgi:hypothetical protein